MYPWVLPPQEQRQANLRPAAPAFKVRFVVSPARPQGSGRFLGITRRQRTYRGRRLSPATPGAWRWGCTLHEEELGSALTPPPPSASPPHTTETPPSGPALPSSPAPPSRRPSS